MTTRTFEQQIMSLPEDLRDLVLERAAILCEAGLDEDEANRRAYEMETGRALPGVARARERDALDSSNANDGPPSRKAGSR